MHHRLAGLQHDVRRDDHLRLEVAPLLELVVQILRRRRVVRRQLRRERAYREIRRTTERIGQDDDRRTGGQEREGEVRE